MLEIISWGSIFILSLVFLLKSADMFTDAAEEIGLFFKLPSFVIGVTIVALGTSLPELVTAVFAVIGGFSEIAVGTAVGSNIANIFLILGVISIIGKKMKLTYEILNVDLPILMASAFLMAVMIVDGEFTMPEAILSLVALSVYLFRIVSSDEPRHAGEQKRVKKDITEALSLTAKISNFPKRSFGKLFFGMILIVVSAKFTIDSAVELSTIFGLSKEVVGASIIAFGTSLPELAVSYRAALRGKAEIAIGNVLGSNIFNALGVMGVAGLFGTIFVPMSILTFSLPIMILATILYLFITQDKEITNWEGAFLLVFYVLYIGKLFNFI